MKKEQPDKNKKTIAANVDSKKPNTEIEKLQLENNELRTGWQRTQADFINFRNRVASEKAELIKTANIDLIEQIIPVLDNFERALNHKPKELENNEYLKGLEYIKIQIEQILNNYGLVRINTKPGDEFDPILHEAITAEENNEYQTDQIIQVIQNGYKLGTKVLRPAQVKVAK